MFLATCARSTLLIERVGLVYSPTIGFDAKGSKRAVGEYAHPTPLSDRIANGVNERMELVSEPKRKHAAKVARRRRRAPGTALGKEIIESLTGLVQVLESGKSDLAHFNLTSGNRPNSSK
jgi:hypothetical protein